MDKAHERFSESVNGQMPTRTVFLVGSMAMGDRAIVT